MCSCEVIYCLHTMQTTECQSIKPGQAPCSARGTNSSGTLTDSTTQDTHGGEFSSSSVQAGNWESEQGEWGAASCWAQHQQCLPGGRSCPGAAGPAGNYAQKSQRKERLFCGSYGSYLQQQRPRAMQSRGWRASDHEGNSSQAQGKWEAEDKAPPVRAGVLSR